MALSRETQIAILTDWNNSIFAPFSTKKESEADDGEDGSSNPKNVPVGKYMSAFRCGVTKINLDRAIAEDPRFASLVEEMEALTDSVGLERLKGQMLHGSPNKTLLEMFARIDPDKWAPKAKASVATLNVVHQLLNLPEDQLKGEYEFLQRPLAITSDFEDIPLDDPDSSPPADQSQGAESP